MSLNAAVLDTDNKPCLVEGERLFFVQDNVELQYESGTGYPGQGHNYHVQGGVLYLTNVRVVYVPIGFKFLKSLNIPLPNLKQGKLIQPWWDANRYEGIVEPVPNGGLRLEGSLKFIFRSGGGFEFSSIFLQLRARISDHDAINEEPLPLYEPNSTSDSTSDSTSRHVNLVPITLPPPNYPANDTQEE
jgi:hypothetical protein